MNIPKSLIFLTLAVLLLASCTTSSAAGINTPVSNGASTITVTKVERLPLSIPGFSGYDIVAVTVTSGAAPFTAEKVLKTSAHLDYTGGTVGEARDAGIDGNDPRIAHFTFIIPQDASNLEFTYINFPPVRLK
jgi:hypothetical protein